MQTTMLLAWLGAGVVTVQSFGPQDEHQSARGNLITSKAKGRVIEKKKDPKKASAGAALPTMWSIRAVAPRPWWSRGCTALYSYWV